MKKSTAELWVKIIAVIGFVGAILTIIAGLALLLGGTFLSALLPFLKEQLYKGIFVGTFLVVLAVIVVAVGTLYFLVSLNLWKHKNWARIVMIVLSVIGIIASLPSLVIGFGLIKLIISAGIFYLLTFQKEIIAFFK